MHRCDPEGTAMQWLIITPRAKYYVSGPLALWRIDGNHKLITYVRLLYYYVITNYLLTKGEVSTGKCQTDFFCNWVSMWQEQTFGVNTLFTLWLQLIVGKVEVIKFLVGQGAYQESDDSGIK